MFACGELLGFLKSAADHVDEWNDHAADDQWDTPAPGLQLVGPHQIRQRVAEYARKHHRNLLTAGLPGYIEALMSRGCYLRKIDRDAAQFDSGREALAQPAQHHHDGREQPDRLVTRDQGNRQRAHRHERERQQQPLAPADVIDVGTEENRPQRTHHETDRKGGHREHQRGKLAAGRKIGTADRGAEIAEDHEVVHFQEVSARHAENRAYLLHAWFGYQHLLGKRERPPRAGRREGPWVRISPSSQRSTYGR